MNIGSRWVVYVDILGFRDMIAESRKAVSKVQEILGLLNAIKSEFAAHGRVHHTQAGEIVRIFSSHDFSDLVVRCTEIPAGASVVIISIRNCSTWGISSYSW